MFDSCLVAGMHLKGRRMWSMVIGMTVSTISSFVRATDLQSGLSDSSPVQMISCTLKVKVGGVW